MEQVIKKDWLIGSVTTYVLMLFGMTIVFYMMGFTNLWTFWNAQGSVFGSGNPITSDIFSNPLVFYGAIFTALAGLSIPAAIVKYTGGANILAYIVPVFFLFIFVNIFVFPITSISNEFSFAGTAITGMIMAFFNLFLILSIIDFVRGGVTS